MCGDYEYYTVARYNDSGNNAECVFDDKQDLLAHSTIIEWGFIQMYGEFYAANLQNQKQNKGDIELLENKFTNEDLKIMQSWSLEQKIKTTQAKIIEFGYVYSDKIYVLLHKVFVNPYLHL